MPFSEQKKLEVKQKATFRCCRCQNIGVDVHHIVPVKDGGKDDMDNAAPLCPSCHDYYGDNPTKRKEITQMRDWWYEKCQEPWTKKGLDLDVLRQIDAKLESIKLAQTDISDLKPLLKNLSDKLINDMTPETASSTASGIVNTFSGASATRLGEKVYAGFSCMNCGTRIGLLVGSNKCPNCGAEIN